MTQKAAIYCRVSTEGQDCDRQERDLVAYAEKAGYEVVGIWKEIGSGAKVRLPERSKVLKLAQARKINIILVTELTRWGRSTIDLIHSLQDLQQWQVSLIAQTGMQFNLDTPQGKLIASIMASLAEFERDLLRERIKSGLAAARARGVVGGRKKGQRPKADKFEKKVLALVEAGESYRDIARSLKLSKTTVWDIVKRHQEKQKKKYGTG